MDHRQRIAGPGNVQFLQGTDVTALLASADKRKIEGVRHRGNGVSIDARDSSGELRADLVIDASGRHSKTPAWLEELGYTPTRAERIDAFLRYASRDYAIPRGFTGDWKGIYLQAKPPHTTRSGVLFQISPDRWRMGLLGPGPDRPPTDEAGFLDFARSLRSPLIYEVISGAEPLSPIRGYQQTANVRRYYEQMRRMPGRLLAIGDSATTFNPIYGQGMTAAAQSASVLDRLLQTTSSGDLDGIGPRFHRAAAKANASAWMIATGEDLRYPTTEGGSRNLQMRLTHRYLERVFRGSLESQRAFLAFIDVMQLVDGPTALFKPTILLPAMLHGGKPDRAAPPETLGMPAPAVELAQVS